MRVFLGVAICLALLAVVRAEAEEPDVVVLTKDNFEDTLKKSPLVMVEFYAPWCGHCKKLAPEYSQAATALKDEDVVLGKVDATIETALGQQYGIEGYPTIKIFREGVAGEYQGGRTADDIIGYLKKNMGPAVKYVDADKLAATIPKEDTDAPIVVAFTDKDSAIDAPFGKFASAHRDNFEFFVAPPAAAKDNGVEAESIVMFKSFDDLKNVYDGKADDSEALLAFLKQNKLKLVDEIGPQNYREYVDRKLPIAWMFTDPEKKDDFDAAIKEYKAVAPDFRKISFVWLSGVQYPQLVQKLALSGNKFPCVSIETMEGEHFPYSEEEAITEAGLRAWLTDYTEGKLTAKIRSEAVPENPVGEDGVYVVVGDTFKDVVLDESKDVLIEFYAPWCGHCKQLAPIWSEVALELKDVEDLVIANMDATANDATGEFQVQAFPTIKFVKKGTNEVVDYSGQNTKSGILAFLKQEAQSAEKIPAPSDEL